MSKKYLLLVGILPLFYSCNKSMNQIRTNYQNNQTIINESSPDEEACTIMYVGKNVSSNGKAIIARSSDAGPGGMNLNVTIFPRNTLANQIVDSHKGFSYKMPSTTYRYISTPRNPVINKGHHWEASAINENGVGVSATLSCSGNPKAIDKDTGADPLVATGIGEDNIAEIVGATATTAREGIQIIADIIDKQGSCECNAIMTIDQNEAWYMEIYSGHQYAAVKMPDNMILTAGNEFVFDSLKKMGITNKDDVILSKNLLETAHLDGKEDFRVPAGCEDVMKLDLFNTYAEALTDDTEEKRIYNDNSHRRTWRGYSLFSTEKHPSEDVQTYKTKQKYDAFYEPDRKLDIHDVKTFMRDRFENVLALDKEGHPLDPNNYGGFKKDYDNHVLRYIGVENAYQIHVIQSDPNLPKYIAATEWLSISNANYTPFVPISIGADVLPDYYTKVSDTYGYDSKSATNIFKKLNTLARTDRNNYGIPIQRFWETYEKIWDEEYRQLLEKTTDTEINTRREIIANYINQTLNTAVNTALFMIDDLTWHMMNDSFGFGNPTEYKPCVNVKDYAHIYGYHYERTGKTVKLNNGDEKYTLTQINDEYRPGTSKDYRPLGQISFGETTQDIDMVIKDQDVYVPIDNLSLYIKGDINLNLDDYKTPFNHAVWIIPVTIIVPIIGGMVFHFVNKKRKEDR